MALPINPLRQWRPADVAPLCTERQSARIAICGLDQSSMRLPSRPPWILRAEERKIEDRTPLEQSQPAEIPDIELKRGCPPRHLTQFQVTMPPFHHAYIRGRHIKDLRELFDGQPELLPPNQNDVLRRSPGMIHFCSLRPIHAKVRFPVR
jgi:hypothetical protein